ncbi:hypothetical protein BU198_33845 [Streptomyces sp. CBMA156]|nr:hypothetical protein [Streptomyces sp. CBMA156]
MPFGPETVLGFARSEEAFPGREPHRRAGVVVRPLAERWSPALGGRAIAEVAGDAYPTRKGGTEYE